MKPHNEDNPHVTRLRTTLDSMSVQRFHACPSVPHKQTIGQHVSSMMTIAIYIVGGAEHISKNLMLAILIHDQSELLTGDIPFTAKRDSAALKDSLENLEEQYAEAFQTQPVELTPLEQEVLKAADMLEGLHWTSLHERGSLVNGVWEGAVEHLLVHCEHLNTPERNRIADFLSTVITSCPN